MFKVMIVDDETFIVSLIQKLIDWDKYQMTVCDVAYDGLSALEKVRLHRPDVVIVDVRMPGCDGISFMQQVREVNDHIRFIVISGHKKFEYAKSAMKYNVEDYLIKPISKEELERILDRLRTELTREQFDRQQQEALSTELTERSQQLQNYLAEVYFCRPHQESWQSEAHINGIYGSDFRAAVYRGLVLKLDVTQDTMDRSFSRKLLEKIADSLREFAARSCHELLLHRESDRIEVLLNYDAAQQDQLRRQLEDCFLSVTRMLAKFEDLRLTMGLGAPADAMVRSHASLEQARTCISARLALGTQKILLFESLHQDPGIEKTVLNESSLRRWQEALRSLQESRIKLQLLDLLNHANQRKLEDNLIFTRVLSRLHRSFYDYLVQIDLYQQPYEPFRCELVENIRWANTYQKLADAFMKQIVHYLEAYSSDDSADVNPAVRIAKNYIAENYQSDITLSVIASLVNLTPVYFSVLFKREVGTNFLDYLNHYRLEISKDLLKDKQYNINEVAVRSGFNDPKYFSKTFKKAYGITPTEYKRRNMQ